MRSCRPTPHPSVLALLFAGLLLVHPASARKGVSLDVADDPTLGETTAELVLIEIADFQ